MSNWHTFVVRPDNKRRPVKNLGWLLRHAHEVTRFHVRETRNSKLYVNMVSGWDVILVAELQDGGVFVSFWSSREVLHGWLNRPVFRNTPVYWVNCTWFKKYNHDIQV